jgi:flavin reductase (DIM6/NTAB) family NADH-FMN oxidoreductase RutF
MKKSLGAKSLMPITPVMLVGTYDADHKPNLMAAAWTGICCGKPPCMNVSLRSATYSHRWIMEHRVFTLVPACEGFAPQADYMGIASGRDTDKFQACGLTPVEGSEVKAPYVDEWPMAIECKVVHIAELGLHTMFVGEVMDVKVDEAYMNEKGLPDVDKLKPIVYTPENRLYHGISGSVGAAYTMGMPIYKK